jgi:hypothetical protein
MVRHREMGQWKVKWTGSEAWPVVSFGTGDVKLSDSASTLLISHRLQTETLKYYLQYTNQEMIPARNAKNVVKLAEVMFVTIQRENILPSKITD